jgi:hypothetical protein
MEDELPRARFINLIFLKIQKEQKNTGIYSTCA